MAGISWVNLAEIRPNPYQVRMAEDAEHVRNLAESIRVRGLMQYPVARRIDGENEGDAVECWQLAFGHSRLAAFYVLVEEDPREWGQMPLIIQNLTDEEMFEFAVQENLDRKDLTPVELARAMTVYREKFGKTSGEIGALFHLSDSAVRNKIRLLDLPENIQARVGAGISEGVARKILSVQAALPAGKAAELAEAIQAKGLETPESVNQEIERMLSAEKAVLMWGSYQPLQQGDKTPRGGVGLWPLDWEPDVPGLVYTSELMRQLKRWKDASWFGKGLVEEIARLMVEEGRGAEDILRRSTWPAGMPEGFVNELEVLCKKPKCTDCPLYVRIESKHFCMLKACWNQRKGWWYQAELERLSAEMGIAIYDKETDGDLTAEARKSVYDRGNYVTLPWETWVAEKAPWLRLKVEYKEWSEHDLTHNRCVQMIGLPQGALAKVLRTHHDHLANAEEDQRQKETRWEMQQKLATASKKFLFEEGAAVFAQILAPLTKPGVLIWLARNVFALPITPDAAAETARKHPEVFHREILRKWLGNAANWDVLQQGPMKVAELLAGWMVEVGITPPEDWDERARRYDPSPLTPLPEGEGVSVETEE